MAVLLVVLLAVVFIVVDLVRVVGQGSGGRQETRMLGSWERKFQNARALVARVIPLTAVKMVVVVWQIVTQVCKLHCVLQMP